MSDEKRDISNVQAEDNKISYFVFESVQARNERTIKRLWISTIILVILLFVSNALWLWFFSGANIESYDYEQGDSGINIIGDENKEVTYNGTESKNTQDNTDERSEEEIYPAQGTE